MRFFFWRQSLHRFSVSQEKQTQLEVEHFLKDIGESFEREQEYNFSHKTINQSRD